MSIIKPKPKQEREQIRIQVDSQVLSEISRYCEYAGFKKPDEFFEEAALHILSKDRDFKEWREARMQPVNTE
ncbi:MAG: hypothetical protein ACYCQI_15785 [Gammaproteobacteria bacterium]